MSAPVAESIAMRAIVSPDAFPVQSQSLRARSAKWRPWRAYALLHVSPSLSEMQCQIRGLSGTRGDAISSGGKSKWQNSGRRGLAT
jgi:hypothetical protein